VGGCSSGRSEPLELALVDTEGAVLRAPELHGGQLAALDQPANGALVDGEPGSYFVECQEAIRAGSCGHASAYRPPRDGPPRATSRALPYPESWKPPPAVNGYAQSLCTYMPCAGPAAQSATATASKSPSPGRMRRTL
jgi:hypothetical protein